MTLLVALVALGLLLCSCDGSNVTPEVVAKIVSALTAGAALAAGKRKAGRYFQHFVERRVIYLTKKNSGWATEAGYASLNQRIAAEMDQVAQFIDERVAALEGNDPVSPVHLDLDDAAKQLTSDGPSAITSRASRFHSERKDRIAQITWRAAAIQPELWTGGDASLAPVLGKQALTEVLDRRLHAVEFMILHDEGSVGSWTIGAPAADWRDQQRTSMFQYPWVEETTSFTSAVTAAGLTIPGLAPDWREEKTEKRIYYKDDNRPRPGAAADWTVTRSPYRIRLTGAGPASSIMERLIPIEPQADPAFEDFWQRNWLYCDMMIAALHLHALRFGRRRRMSGDADFNAAAGAGVTLRPLIPKVGVPDPRQLMTNGPQWFEGAAISHEELQVGDHLVYWNSLFVRHILRSAFGLENSFVTSIVGDGRTVMLTGHGLTEMAESAFAEAMASEIQAAYDALRRSINRAFAADNDVAVIGLTRMGVHFQLLRWEPFGELFAPSSSAQLTADGAWWVRAKLEQLHDQGEPAPNMTEALAAMPKSVRVDPSRHTQMPPAAAGGYAADFQESVYLPLSTPRGVRGGWAVYLANPSPGEAVDLDDLTPDGSMVPGFYARGSGTIPVLRPKVLL